LAGLAGQAMRCLPRCLPAALFACLSLDALAARPFVTDDARLTTAGSCQLASWTRIYRHSHEVWALPACNPFGNFELTLGGGRARSDGESATRDYVLQGKTLFRELQTNDWGIGLAAGTVRHPEISPGPNLLGNTYAYLPVSVSVLDDALVLHTNLGWLRDRATKKNRVTWGMGAEVRLGARLTGIAETFGENRGNPYFQVGARLAIIPDRVQVDATVGQQLSGSGNSRWLSFGLRLTPASLF